MEKKNVPKIRFPGFTEPWEQRKLGEVAEIVGGGTPSTTNEKYWDGDIDWYTPAEINNQIYVEGSERKITELGLKKSSARILPAYKTVLFTSRAGIGKMAILRKSGTTNQGFQSIVLNDDTDSYFIYSMGSNIKEKAEKVASGSTFAEISGKALGNLNFMFPNKTEQKKIGDLFEKLDNLISLHQRKLENLKKQKKGLLQKMFPEKGKKVPEIRFPEFTDDWEQRKVSELFKITRGYVLATTEVDEKSSDEKPYPVYSSQTKNNGLMGYYSDYLYENAITWTTDGANAGTVNYRSGKFYCTNVCGVLLSEEGYANKMVSEALNLIAWKYVSKVGNPKLMNNVMSEIEIYLPNAIEEQKQIGNFFEKFDNLISLHQRKLEHLQKQKKALLQQMFV
ncbi:MAG: restriction endonuclease subunit S [Clostridium sp.]